VGVFLVSCKKSSSPTTTSSTTGTIRCSTSSTGTWYLYNAAATPYTYVDSSNSTTATFSEAAGSYVFLYVVSGSSTQSAVFQVTVGKTTTVSFYGDFTISGPS
jgi:hypothetical protein